MLRNRPECVTASSSNDDGKVDEFVPMMAVSSECSQMRAYTSRLTSRSSATELDDRAGAGDGGEVGSERHPGERQLAGIAVELSLLDATSEQRRARRAGAAQTVVAAADQADVIPVQRCLVGDLAAHRARTDNRKSASGGHVSPRRARSRARGGSSPRGRAAASTRPRRDRCVRGRPRAPSGRCCTPPWRSPPRRRTR